MSMSVVAQGALDCNTGSVQADINLTTGVGGHIKLTGNLGEAGTSADIAIPGSNCIADPMNPHQLDAALYHVKLNGRDCQVFVGANPGAIEVRIRAASGTPHDILFTQVLFMGKEVPSFVKPTGAGAVYTFAAA